MHKQLHHIARWLKKYGIPVKIIQDDLSLEFEILGHKVVIIAGNSRYDIYINGKFEYRARYMHEIRRYLVEKFPYIFQNTKPLGKIPRGLACVTVYLPQWLLEEIERLVSMGIFSTRSEGIRFLLMEGYKSFVTHFLCSLYPSFKDIKDTESSKE